TAVSIADFSDKNVEIIFVIDGEDVKNNSNIQMLEELKSDPDLNVTFITLPKRCGPSVAKNVGVTVSTGDVILYANIGHAINPGYVEYLKTAYSNNPDMDILFTGAVFIHPNIGEQLKSPYSTVNKVKQRRGNAKNLLKFGVDTPISAVSHKRAMFYIIGGFQPGIASGEEDVAWRRIGDFIAENSVYFSDIVECIYTTR